MALGKLNRLDPRLEWSNESKNFTPWLSSQDGLNLLGETLGLELELKDTEVYVGNYRADIVAKDSISNEYVVIENQLSSTDHDHIGKLLTYAASFEAGTVVWIAKNFREEHRQALDWFNEITIKDVDFFGIEIELLQIGDSPYAPNLKIVSKPNEWTRSVRSEKQSLTERDTLKVEYWTAFNEYISSNNVKIKQRKVGAQHWYDIAIGKADVHFSLTLRTNKGDIACEVYIGDENAKDLFHNLYSEKDEIEEIIGEDIEWKELPEGKSCRIVVRNFLDPKKKDNWEDCFKWYDEMVARFRKAFVKRIIGF